MKSRLTPFLFSRLSIQQRLPLLIYILLLSVVVIFGYTSYVGIENAELSAGKERLTSLTKQLSSLLQQSNNFLIPQARGVANKESIKKYLESNGKDSVVEAKQTLSSATEDTLTPLVELFNANRVKVLNSDKLTIIDECQHIQEYMKPEHREH